MMKNKKIKIVLYLKFIAFCVWLAIIWFSFFKNNFKENRLKEWNIIFLLDISNSMNVKDVFYGGHLLSRLDLAKKIIENNVAEIDKNFWLILFSNKFDYFIPSTKDKESFKTYLNTVNTNTLDAWDMKFVQSISWSQNVLNPTDTLILISDFDTQEDLTKIKFKNYTYAIWIWKNHKSVVYNRFWNKVYTEWKLQDSAFSQKKLDEILVNAKINISEYWRWDLLDFLKVFKNKNLFQEGRKNINYLDIIWFSLIILAF